MQLKNVFGTCDQKPRSENHDQKTQLENAIRKIWQDPQLTDVMQLADELRKSH